MVVAFAAALQITKLPAQPAGEEQIRVAVCSLLETNPPPLYYRTAEGDYERFFVVSQNRNRYHELPEAKRLQLYKEAVTPEGTATFQPSLAFDLISGAQHQLFLLHNQAKGGYAVRAINSDADAHPGGVIRLLNLLEHPVAVQISDRRFEVTAGESRDLEPEFNGTAENRFLFTYAYQRDRTRPYVSPTKRIRLLNGKSRLLIVFTQGVEEIRGSTEQGNQYILKPKAVHLYDTVPSEPES